MQNGFDFDHACKPLLKDFMNKVNTDVIGEGLSLDSFGVDNQKLISINEKIRNHPVEIIGKKLRHYMTEMKKVV